MTWKNIKYQRRSEGVNGSTYHYAIDAEYKNKKIQVRIEGKQESEIFEPNGGFFGTGSTLCYYDFGKSLTAATIEIITTFGLPACLMCVLRDLLKQMRTHGTRIKYSDSTIDHLYNFLDDIEKLGDIT